MLAVGSFLNTNSWGPAKLLADDTGGSGGELGRELSGPALPLGASLIPGALLLAASND